MNGFRYEDITVKPKRMQREVANESPSILTTSGANEAVNEPTGFITIEKAMKFYKDRDTEFSRAVLRWLQELIELRNHRFIPAQEEENRDE